jgi:UDP-N-acetylglucosamine--N-acetylmuramyl-(pentapeptide) pyrophosphoryl-undecaprenol N-acetylglucosamine transferase
MGIPVLVHESNAFPGITVKTLAKEGATILLCNESARKHLPAGSKAIVTGNPLRADFMQIGTKQAKENARKELGLDDRPLVLSFGGSLGAKYINEAMVGVLQKSVKAGKLQHIHGVGSGGYAETCAALKDAGVPLNGNGISVREYIDDMARCMAAADLIISRCGAMTLSEIPAAGKPAILIPSPYVAENHQYHNAMTLVQQDAALCIEEKDLSADSLWEAILSVTDSPARLVQMGENAAKMAILDADVRILSVIQATLAQR